jgi:hypothetical protein
MLRPGLKDLLVERPHIRRRGEVATSPRQQRYNTIQIHKLVEAPNATVALNSMLKHNVPFNA